jgi:hypothetical protein
VIPHGSTLLCLAARLNRECMRYRVVTLVVAGLVACGVADVAVM